MEVYMKKIALAALLCLILAAGAFADHPGGLGIGVVGAYHGNWDAAAGYPQYGLSLKAPGLPAFWGICLRINDSFFQLSLTCDKYIIDQTLIAGFGWFIGLGAYANTVIPSGNGEFGLGFGARLPIGLSVQPVNILEIFVDIAPSVGISLVPSFDFPNGGWPVEFGIRLWL
jgi:hypothetical protein